MRRYAWRYVLSVVAVAVLTTFTNAKITEAAPVDKVIKATFMSVYPPSHQQYKLTTRYLDMVEEATKGGIKFERYPSSQLCPERQALDAVGKGVFQILNSYSGYYSGQVATGAMGFPGAWPNPASWAFNFLEDAELRDLVTKQFLETCNVVIPLMHAFTPGSCFIMGKGKEIRSMADFKGKKIRSPGGEITPIYDELGAAGVMLIGSEWYTGMQRGTVDGVMGYPYAIRTYKLLEVARSMTALRLVPTICPMIFINADFWKGLPQEIKKVMFDLNKKWTWEIMMPSVTEEEVQDWNLGKEKGLEIIRFPREEGDKVFKIAAKIGRESYLSQCRKQGYGELSEKLVARMAKATEEWPALEKKLLKEGTIKAEQYMYPSE
ncbi:MAG: hypothetical protein C4576_28610 [Desulfobacteraceae bacterium]|nr:MAG: hypothetical protein C4576_28610 [Desulfobacteraceae bacterium]